MERCNFTKLIILALIFISITNIVFAEGLSISLKRTNPGIVDVKPAEIIFDIVNTDFDHKIEGFVLCRSPDDIQISSTLGLGSGSGAQYVSPIFEMDKAPSQKAVYFTVESNYPGDYNTNCIFKYIPFRETDGKRIYVKMNIQETSSITDSDYRSIRLDKTVPFVEGDEGFLNAYCPNGKNECKSSEIIIIKVKDNPVIYLYLTIVLIAGMVFLAIKLFKKNKV